MKKIFLAFVTLAALTQLTEAQVLGTGNFTMTISPTNAVGSGVFAWGGQLLAQGALNGPASVTGSAFARVTAFADGEEKANDSKSSSLSVEWLFYLELDVAGGQISITNDLGYVYQNWADASASNPGTSGSAGGSGTWGAAATSILLANSFETRTNRSRPADQSGVLPLANVALSTDGLHPALSLLFRSSNGEATAAVALPRKRKSYGSGASGETMVGISGTLIVTAR